MYLFGKCSGDCSQNKTNSVDSCLIFSFSFSLFLCTLQPKLGVCKIDFKILCSPRLKLFEQKFIKTVILLNIITIFTFNIIKMSLIPVIVKLFSMIFQKLF